MDIRIENWQSMNYSPISDLYVDDVLTARKHYDKITKVFDKIQFERFLTMHPQYEKDITDDTEFVEDGK